MEYNKNQFRKINDQKLLHKIGKKWVVISAFMLFAIGGSIAEIMPHAHADINTNNNRNKLSLNQKTNQVQSNQKITQSQQSKNVNTQAKALHAKILNSNAQNQVHNYVSNINHQFNQYKQNNSSHNNKNNFSSKSGNQIKIPTSYTQTNNQGNNIKLSNNNIRTQSNNSNSKNSNQNILIKPIILKNNQKKLITNNSINQVGTDFYPKEHQLGFQPQGQYQNTSGVFYPEGGSGGGQWVVYVAPDIVDPNANPQTNPPDSSTLVDGSVHGIGSWSDVNRGVSYDKVFYAQDGSVWIHASPYSALMGQNYTGWLNTKHTFALDNDGYTYLSLNVPGPSQLGTYGYEDIIYKDKYSHQDEGSYRAKGVRGGPGTATGRGINAGYILAKDGSSDFTYPSLTITPGTHTVNVVRGGVTDTLNYMYNGQNMGSSTATGNQGQIFNIDDYLKPGWNLHGTNILTFGNGNETIPINVSPQQVTDHIHYIGDGVDSWQDFSGNDYRTGVNGSFTIGSHPTGLSSQYHVANPNQSFNYDGDNHDVQVAKNIMSDNIQFDLSGSNIPANNVGPTGIITSDKTDYSGSGNYTFTNNATNLKGMPAHYHIAGNQTINYDGGTHKVEIAPDTVTDTVNYIYKGHGNNIYNRFHPQGIYDTNNTINWDDYGYNQMPTNWNISNDGTQNWVFNGGSHNVNVQPNRVSDTIYYQYNGTTKGQNTFYGNDSGAKGASDTSFVIGNSPANLPTGYYVINPNQSIPYNYAGKYNVAIAPVQDNDYVQYRYNNTLLANSSDIKGNANQSGVDGTFTINDKYCPGIPAGYHLDHGDGIYANGLTFYHMNGSHQVYVKPNTYTETVNYIVQNNGNYAKRNQILNHYSKTLNDNQAIDAGNNSLTINNSNQPNLPTGYHLISSYTFSHPAGQNYTDIAWIAPNSVTQHINYWWFNRSVGSANMNGYYDNTGIINGTGLNPGWHVNNGATFNDTDGNGHFTFNGGTTTIGVLPNTVTDHIHYTGDGANSWQNFSGNDYRTGDNGSFTIGSNPTGLPAHYHVVNPNQVINYDGSNHDVQVARNTATDTIHYIYKGYGNIIPDSKGGNSDFHVNGAYGTNNAINWNDTTNDLIPENWHISNDGTQNWTFNDGIHNVDITPNSASVTVNYIYNGQNEGSHTFSGNYYKARGAKNTNYNLITNPIGITKGFHILNTNEVINYDNGTHNIQVAPNNHSIMVNYINQNNVNVDSGVVNSNNGIINWPMTAPRGYFIDDGQETTHTIQNSDIDNNGNLTKGDFNADGSHNIYVTGDKANLKINFSDSGNIISSDDFNGTNAIGDTLSDIQIPKGYVPNGTLYNYNSNHNTFDYEFKPSDIDKSKPISSNTATMNSDTISLKPDSALVHVCYVDSSNGKVIYRTIARNYIGRSFKSSSNDNPLKLPNIHNLSKRYSPISNQELNYTFKSDNIKFIEQNQASCVMKDYTIYVHRNNVSQLKVIYLDSDEKQIGNPSVVNGDIGDKLEILNYGDEPTNNSDLVSYAPNGCHINNETVVLTNMSPKNLYVRADRNNVTNTVNIIQVIKNSDGSNTVNSTNTTLTGYRGEYKTLSASDYLNNLNNSSNYEVNHNVNNSNKATVSLTSDSNTNPDNVIFYYRAKNIKDAELTIHLMNHGKIIKTLKPISGQLGNTINSNQIKNDIGQLPNGYSINNVNSGLPSTYTFSSANDNMYINLKGNPIPNAQKFTIYQVEENLDGTIHTVATPVSINTNVGSGTLITPYSSVPNGYHAINGNASFKVHYNSDGILEPISSIDYLYGQDYNPNNSNKIGKIRVHYVTDNQLKSGIKNDNSGVPNYGEVDEESDSEINGENFNINPYLEDIPEEVNNNYDLDNSINPTSNIVNNIDKFNNETQDVYIKVKSNQNGLIILS